jgi:DNA-binding transcriptional MerR regulator
MMLALPPEKEYFSIGDVSRVTGVKPYVLRYWESRFGLLRPSRRESGQRKFTRKDVETIVQIKELLYDRRFTIEGARRHLRQQNRRGPSQMTFELAESAAAVETLREVKRDLADVLRKLKSRPYTPAGAV